MIKKLFLALLMLVVIFAVGYIKIKRGNASTENSYQEAQSEVREQLWGYEQMVDSLKYLMGQQDFRHEKLLQRNVMQYQREIDSLVHLLDEGTSPSTESIPLVISESEPEIISAEALALQTEIIDYYKNLYGELPKDLSSYELRVALYEIRLKTAGKFQINLRDLKELRSRSNLTY